jgi:hypothetical protein
MNASLVRHTSRKLLKKSLDVVMSCTIHFIACVDRIRKRRSFGALRMAMLKLAASS